MTTFEIAASYDTNIGILYACTDGNVWCDNGAEVLTNLATGEVVEVSGSETDEEGKLSKLYVG